jgi:hypothetical protein
MPVKIAAILRTSLAVLLVASVRASAQADSAIPFWQVEPRPGEDLLVVRRNAALLAMATARNNRVTIVKFDDDLENKCPTLTSLFYAAGDRVELLTPNFSIRDSAGTTTVQRKSNSIGDGFVVQNSTCRYLLTVRRYDRDGEVEKDLQIRRTPPPLPPIKVEQQEGLPANSPINPVIRTPEYKVKSDPIDLSGNSRDEKIGFEETHVRFEKPSYPLNFTGIAFFAPTTLTVYLANAERDLTIASESNFLTHDYKIEIKNPKAVLRIAVDKEFYSNGQWKNAYSVAGK